MPANAAIMLNQVFTIVKESQDIDSQGCINTSSVWWKPLTSVRIIGKGFILLSLPTLLINSWYIWTTSVRSIRVNGV